MENMAEESQVVLNVIDSEEELQIERKKLRNNIEQVFEEYKRSISIFEKQQQENKSEYEKFQKNPEIIQVICKIQAFTKMKLAVQQRKQLKKQAQYRMNIIKELIETQKSYMRDLKIIIDKVRNPLMEEQVLNEPETIALFSNIQQIHNLNEQFLADLEQQFNLAIENFAQQIFTTKICDTIIYYIHFFKLYVTYCSNYEKSMNTLQTLQRTNQGFLYFIMTIERTQILNNSELSSFLIKPVQRLPRYELLLKELLKQTDKLHPDFLNIEQAYNLILTVNKENDHQLDQCIRAAQLFELHQLFYEKISLIDGKREYCFQEVVSIMHMDKNEGREQQIQMYFFTDLILIAQSIGNSVNYVKFFQVLLLNANSQARDDSEINTFKHYQNIVSIKGKNDLVIVICQSETMKNDFITRVSSHLQKLRDKIFGKNIIIQQDSPSQSLSHLLEEFPVEVTVLGTEERNSNMFAQYTIYIVEIVMGPVIQKIFVRYSEMVQLDNLIKSNIKMDDLPHFTRINWFSKHQTQTIESRQILIETFLQKVLMNELIITNKQIKSQLLTKLGLSLNFYQLPLLMKERSNTVMGTENFMNNFGSIANYNNFNGHNTLLESALQQENSPSILVSPRTISIDPTVIQRSNSITKTLILNHCDSAVEKRQYVRGRQNSLIHNYQSIIKEPQLSKSLQHQNDLFGFNNGSPEWNNSQTPFWSVPNTNNLSLSQVIGGNEQINRRVERAISQYPDYESGNQNFQAQILCLDETFVNIKYNEKTKSLDICREIAKQLGMMTFLDFRIFVTDQSGQSRVLDQDEILFKITKGQVIQSSIKKSSFLQFFSFAKENIKLYFQKYIWLQDDTEEEDYRVDPIRLRLIVSQVKQEISQMKYNLQFKVYAQYCALFLYQSQYELVKNLITFTEELNIINSKCISAKNSKTMNNKQKKEIKDLYNEYREKVSKQKQQVLKSIEKILPDIIKHATNQQFWIINIMKYFRNLDDIYNSAVEKQKREEAEQIILEENKESSDDEVYQNLDTQTHVHKKKKRVQDFQSLVQSQNIDLEPNLSGVFQHSRTNSNISNLTHHLSNSQKVSLINRNAFCQLIIINLIQQDSMFGVTLFYVHTYQQTLSEAKQKGLTLEPNLYLGVSYQNLILVSPDREKTIQSWDYSWLSQVLVYPNSIILLFQQEIPFRFQTQQCFEISQMIINYRIILNQFYDKQPQRTYSDNTIVK